MSLSGWRLYYFGMNDFKEGERWEGWKGEIGVISFKRIKGDFEMD